VACSQWRWAVVSGRWSVVSLRGVRSLGAQFFVPLHDTHDEAISSSTSKRDCFVARI
jgi:hypothetical protein